MEKILASFNDAIYIGSGHSDIIKCTDNVSKEYDKIFVVFQMRNKEIVPLLAKRCPNCNKVFLPYKKYEKFCYRFESYIFIRSKDGKPPYQEVVKNSDFKPNPNYKPEPLDFHEVYKTPSYIKKGLRHPFQGGRFSPR